MNRVVSGAELYYYYEARLRRTLWRSILYLAMCSQPY